MPAVLDDDPDDVRPAITIALSPAQVDDVVRAAAGGPAPSVSALIAGSLRPPEAAPDGAEDDHADPDRAAGGAVRAPGGEARGYLPGDTGDRRLSRSLFRGLSILACFGSDGRPRGIVDISRELGMSPSTAHRYAQTLVELGLLDRDPRSRRYRLPNV
ncbi:MAG TPA: helix-turn-helix domain-containing protein [Solirubrobacteraceae bacterium]|jgi:hypothetical protein|nr:helix-turn-helix domain-containing protein [Solirubrobacteraceae bacterium]